MRRINLAFTLLLTMLVISSCSKGSDDGEFTPSGGNGSLKMTIGAMSPSLACEVIAASQDGSEVETRFSSKWGDNATCEVWAKQSGELVYLGKQNVAITSSDKQKGEVNIDGTGKLDASKPYEVIGLGCSWRRDGNELYYRTDLHRGGNFGLYFKTVSGQWSVETSSRVAGTAEILYVINKTDKPVKFRHRGFDAEQKWYYTHAEVSIDKGIIVNTEQEGDAVSEEGEVPVFTGKNAFKVFSYYVPNGNKIQNAQLIAEIDGKEVRSENRISSDIVLQTDHAYGIFAVWDGEKLTLGDGGDDCVIEIPTGSDLTINDIKVIGDGENLDVGTDGNYKTENCNLMAIGKNNRIMYMNHTSVCGKPKKDNSKLNAHETAISLLLPIFPNIYLQESSDEGFLSIKNLIGALPETQTLASAIDKSIVKNGYLEMDDIDAEYGKACDKIFNLTGLQKHLDKLSSTRSVHRAAPQSNPSFNGSNSVSYKGLEVQLDKTRWTHTFASWLTQARYVNAWECTINAYNSNRWAFTSISNAIRQDEGVLEFRTSENLFVEQTAHMLKPQNASHFMSSTKSWGFLEDTFNLFFKEDFGFEDMTWDKTKLEGVKLYFTIPQDVIYVAAPGDNDNLKIFNLAHLLLSDVLSVVMSDFATVYSEGEEPYTDCLLAFLQKCMQDKNFLIKVLEIEAMTIPDTEKVRQWFKLFFDKWLIYVRDDFEDWAKKSAVEWYKNNFRKRAISDIQNLLKSNAFLWEKQIEKWSKPIMLFIGTSYEQSYYININLDFNVPSTGLEDVPGSYY